MNVLYYDDVGRILSVHSVAGDGGSLPPAVTPPFESRPANKLILPDHFPAASIENFYVKGGVVVPLPAKPQPYMEFDYALEQWVDKRSSGEVAYRATRRRNALLVQSDWTQLPDVPLETKSAWAEYRQALRDITEQPGYPFNIVWPTPPQ